MRLRTFIGPCPFDSLLIVSGKEDLTCGYRTGMRRSRVRGIEGRGTAQQVMCKRAITAPLASFQRSIACGVGRSSTAQFFF